MKWLGQGHRESSLLTHTVVIFSTLVLDFHKTPACCFIPTMNLATVNIIFALIYVWDKVEYIKK